MRCHGARETRDARSLSFKVMPAGVVPSGRRQVRMEFAYDAGGLGKGGTVSRYVDGEKVCEGRVDATQPLIFSTDETTDVGSDGATPVSDDDGPRDSHFSGRVHWVQLDIDAAAEDLDHLVTPGERFRIAMARQQQAEARGSGSASGHLLDERPAAAE
jgi:hypothetical protein